MDNLCEWRRLLEIVMFYAPCFMYLSIVGQFDSQSETLGGATGCQKSSTTFLTLSQIYKVRLLLRYSIKNLSIEVV